MKKNIMKVAMIAAFGLFTGYTVYSSQKEETALSEVLLDNVEAMAGGEVGIGTICVSTSYNYCYYPPCCGSSDNDLWVDNARPL